MRLVTFGCSITYGQWLTDTDWTKSEGLTPPSKLAWPSKLGEMLNLEVVNKATPGAGNYLIAHQITNFVPNKNDIIIVMWSYKDRYNIITNASDFGDLGSDAANSTIGPWTKSKKAIAFYKHLYNDTDALVRSQHYINYVKLYLNTFDVKHFHTVCYKENYKGVKDLNVNIIRKEDLAADNSHPGPKSHIAIAKAVYNYIKEEI